jgi:hypothetical protein
MRSLNFYMKPSIENCGEDLSDDAFVWASRNIRGRDGVEQFVSCGIWSLAGDVSFEHVKVGLTPVSKLKVPLPRFPLFREDGEDDASLLARVEQEARNIVGSYTRAEHEACVSGLPNNGHLNRVLELTGVAYGPRPTPASAEVLKKRKAEASGNVLAKRPKAPEKKSTEPVKVSGAHAKGGLKRPLGADILPTKSVNLSKGIVPHAIALVVVARITHEVHNSTNMSSASGSKAGGRDPGSKAMSGARNVALSTKKRIVPASGALAAISSEGTQESSPYDQAPEVQSKAGLRSQTPGQRVRSPMTSGPRPNSKAFVPVTVSTGAARASTCYLRLVKFVHFCVVKRVSNSWLMLVSDIGNVEAGALVVCEGAQGDDAALLSYLERVSYTEVFFTITCLIL